MLLSMRTTVSIQDEAFELCKKKAQENRTSIGEVITEAIFTAYRDKANKSRSRRFSLPASGKGGLHPGVDLDCTAELEDIMDGSR